MNINILKVVIKPIFLLEKSQLMSTVYLRRGPSYFNIVGIIRGKQAQKKGNIQPIPFWLDDVFSQLRYASLILRFLIHCKGKMKNVRIYL